MGRNSGHHEFSGQPAPPVRQDPAGSRLGDLSAMVRLTGTLQGSSPPSPAQKRQMVARFCKMLAAQAGIALPGPCDDPKLSPRQRQTLQGLLAGDSEKQVAAKLRVSPHTVHIYVKSLYKHYQVSSRGELLAKCLPERQT